MTKRLRLTPRERREMEKAQAGLCACGECNQPLSSGPVEEEHYRPVALGGNAKPDALWLSECHARKTRQDRKNIAKDRRLRGVTPSQWNGDNRGRGRLSKCSRPLPKRKPARPKRPMKRKEVER